MSAALIQAAATARADAALALLRALIAAQPDGEAAVQNCLADALRAAGATVRDHRYFPADVQLLHEFAAQPPPEERSAILGEAGAGDGPSMILFAHPDSEPLQPAHGWSVDPFAGVVRDGRLYGWGISDDLSGVAIMVSALDVLRAAGLTPRGRVVVASTPSKRHARGVHALLHSLPPADAAVYLHPAESGAGMGEVKTHASGQLEFRIVVKGRAPDTTEPGHTSFAHLAVNAIDKARIVLDALSALDAARGARVRHAVLDAAIGRATNLLVAGITGGGPKASRMPLECVITGAIAFPPGETLEAVRADIETAIADAARSDAWLAAHPPSITFPAGVTGAEVPDGHPLLEATRRVIAEQTGTMPFVNPLHTASDIRNPMVQKGIPCVGIGPLGGSLTQNGQVDEWVDVADHLRAVAVTAALIAEWCGVEAG